MRWTRLVPSNLCQIPCKVVIYGEGLTIDGAPEVVFTGNLKCNYQDSASTTLTDEQKLVDVTAKCYFAGDISPSVSEFSSGEVTIFGVTRSIVRGSKARNLDGTVNFTLLELK